MRSASLDLPSARVRMVASDLGNFVRIARKRRRLTLKELSLRARTTVTTLRKVENGDLSVAAGTVFSILWALDLIDIVGKVFDPTLDCAGLAQENRRLPKRIRKKNDLEDF
ncbi:MAG: helix-turn-helix domain-containing protein [Leptospirales bacterium]